MFPSILQLLNEVTLQQATARFKSKRFLRASAAQREKDQANKLAGKYGYKDRPFTQTDHDVEEQVLVFVPADIPDRDKGEALNWLITMFIKSHRDLSGDFLEAADYYELHGSLEVFFQTKEQNLDHFLPKKELANYQQINDFSRDMETVAGKVTQHNEKKSDEEDAEEFMNLIGETPEWQVYIPESKAAACELGKGTRWCTAAPGLNYYHDYHEDHNPLIILKNKRDESKHVQIWFDVEGWEQVHGPNRAPPEPIAGGGYGGRVEVEWEPQFMDVHNEDLDWARRKEALKIVEQFKSKLPREVLLTIDDAYYK